MFSIEVPPATRSRASIRAGVTSAPVGIAVMAIIGMVVVLYPTMAAWFSSRAQDSAVAAYLDRVSTAPVQEREAALARAHAYNAAIPQILLTDPYTVEDARAGRGGAYQEYAEQLVVEGISVIGRLRIPSIGVSLTVRHGTAEDTLELGAGHLFGSSLPVGGPGTHSVITAHSGLVTARMFNDLEDLEVGQDVLIDVLGRTVRYRVTSTEVVEPTGVSGLQQQPVRDQLTLVTCTPTGANTHRLLVHADRVPDPAASATDWTSVPGDSGSAGFPWWIPGLLVGSLGVVVVVRLAGRPVHDNRFLTTEV